MSLSWRKCAGVFAVFLLTGTSWPCQAQEQVVFPADSYEQESEDPPSRAGRVSFLEGTVSRRFAGDDGWTEAALNYPVTSGSSFWAEPDSRAEIRVGSNAVRMDGGTELTMQRLDDRLMLIDFPQGVVNVHIGEKRSEERYQIITPRGEVFLDTPGDYRIEAGTERLPAVVAVLSGSARFAADTAVTIAGGETVTVIGVNPVSYMTQATEPTAFDNWSLARNYQRNTSETVRYVSTDMTGYEDLGTYGSWQTVPEYGPVWTPASVPMDWEPYRYGHWEWIAPWGWTWIDDAPWGFAPFHYGRWFHANGRWHWWPGDRVLRPVYAPALVAFIGGSDFQVVVASGRFPAIGWVPLAPYEVYDPFFRASPRYFHNVNVYAVRNITVITHERHDARHPRRHESFANRRFATVVHRDDFVHGHHVKQKRLNVSSGALDAVPVASRETLPGHPSRALREATVSRQAPEPAARAPRVENRTGRQSPRSERGADPVPTLSGTTAPSATEQPAERRRESEARPQQTEQPSPKPASRRINREEKGDSPVKPERRSETPSVRSPSPPDSRERRQDREAPKPRPIERREWPATQSRPEERREIQTPPQQAVEPRVISPAQPQVAYERPRSSPPREEAAARREPPMMKQGEEGRGQEPRHEQTPRPSQHQRQQSVPQAAPEAPSVQPNVREERPQDSGQSSRRGENRNERRHSEQRKDEPGQDQRPERPNRRD